MSPRAIKCTILKVTMNAALHCPEHTKMLMCEFLENRGLIVSEAETNLLVCEEGYEPAAKPYTAVTLCYRPDRLHEFDECLRALFANPANSAPRELNKSIIMGKREDCFEIVKLEDIFAFESIGDDTYCHTPAGRLGVKPKLYEIERAYADRGFIRISKPYIVNVSRIAEVVPWFSGKILLRMDGMKETLEVSRNYARQFKDFLGMP